jgi:hypothetical protein
MRRLILLLVALLALAAFVRVVDAASDHADGACPVASWTNKTGPTTLWWKTVTACNDHISGELQHNVHVQIWDWDELRWKDVTFAVFVGSEYDVWFMGTSRYREVTPYGGAACYRIRTHHFVVEAEKYLMADGDSFSLQHCY